MEAKARAIAEKQERLRKARIAVIQGKLWQQVGLAVIPLSSEIKVEQPTRKKPKDTGGPGDDSGLAYLLSGASMGILLGVAAGITVLEVISTEAEKRLSDKEKKQIEAAAKGLSGILAARSVEQNLRQRVHGELIIKLLREAARVFGSESANGSNSTMSAIQEQPAL